MTLRKLKHADSFHDTPAVTASESTIERRKKADLTMEKAAQKKALCVLCECVGCEGDMISQVCDCQKKSDMSAAHKSCLEKQWDYCEQEFVEPLTQFKCQSCNQGFRVAIRHQFKWRWSRFLSMLSLFHTGEFVFILIATMGLVAVFGNVMISGHAELEESLLEKRLIIVAFMLTQFGSIMALRAVVQRWKLANSDKTIEKMPALQADPHPG